MVEEFDINSNECLGKFDFFTYENFNTFFILQFENGKNQGNLAKHSGNLKSAKIKKTPLLTQKNR